MTLALLRSSRLVIVKSFKKDEFCLCASDSVCVNPDLFFRVTRVQSIDGSHLNAYPALLIASVPRRGERLLHDNFSVLFHPCASITAIAHHQKVVFSGQKVSGPPEV